MRAISAFLLIIFFGAVCCKPEMKTLSSVKTQGGSASNPIENTEHIRSVDVYKAKVAERLRTSIILAHQPDTKVRLLEIAVDKFKNCENLEIEFHDNHPCLRSVTGQMMILIRAFEKNPMLDAP